MGKKGIYHYLAGVFFLTAILCVVCYAFKSPLFDPLNEIMWFKFEIICYLLLAVSVFANRPIFTVFGGAVFLFNFVAHYKTITNDAIILTFAYSLCGVFLILTGFLGMKHKDTRIPAVIAGLLALVLFTYNIYIIYTISNGRLFHSIRIIEIWSGHILSYSKYFFLGLGSIFMGFAFSIKEKKVSTINGLSSMEIGSNKIEQLTKLTGLLEKGIITQEEFDAKKKQLLGL